MMNIDTSHIVLLLSGVKNATVIGHFNPDGDSVGSITAAYHYLSDRGIRTSIVLPSPYPDSMAFLEPERPEDHMIICEKDMEGAFAAVAGAEVILCLDFNSLRRTEYLEETILASKAPKILIDHHVSPEVERFDCVVSTTEVSSACELLFWTLMSMPDIAGDTSRISLRCASSLYVGMMTDTNNFSNSVLPSTFEMASMLVARGVDKDDLQEKILHCYSVPRTRLMGHMVKDNMHIIEKYDAAYMTLSNKEKNQYSFKPGDSEGFVNLPLAISAIRMSALFTENFDGAYIRVSLRSKGNLDVNKFCRRYFNGGGHVNASGGRLYMPLKEVPEYFGKVLAEYMEEEKFS